jgi:hypothetical protein
MVRPNYNLIRFIRDNIYRMKQDYGSPITVYKLTSVDTDYETGEKSASRTAYPITRAVVLPVNIKREVIQSISVISANKKIVQGGMYDVGMRTFIIDRRDASFTDLNNDDWIVFDNKRYDIKAIQEFEQRTAWLIVARELEGVVPAQDLPAVCNDSLFDMTQTATATVA